MTNLGNANLTDSSNRVAASNSAITDAMLGTGGAGDPTRDDVLAFINNVDVADANGNNSTTDARDQMGDPLHSQPTTVVYGPSPDNAVVYFATNDGFLHAIDAKTGVEKWAFVPKEFLGTQVLELLDRTAATKNYAIDGSLRIQFKANNDGTIDPANEKVFLFFGLRRGGDSYYALDVTRPDSPQFMWRLDHTNLPGVGQSWSTPVPTRMLISGAGQNPSNFVLVLGGGYEPDQDNDNASTDATGNSIYIVDSETGGLLWQGTKTGGTKSFNATGKAMDYSIPAEVKVVDFDGDGYADRMYAADMGGQVWRFDVINGQSAANLVTGGVIAQLGAASLTPPAPVAATRRFYYSPDVALVATKDFNFIHVGIGSGHRAHPLSLMNQDRFYAIRDYNGVDKLSQTAYDGIIPYKDSDLVDITNDVNAHGAARSARVAAPAARRRLDRREGARGGAHVQQSSDVHDLPSIAERDELRAAGGNQSALHRESVRRLPGQQPGRLSRQRPAHGDGSLHGVQGLDLERSGVHLPAGRRGLRRRPMHAAAGRVRRPVLLPAGLREQPGPNVLVGAKRRLES